MVITEDEKKRERESEEEFMECVIYYRNKDRLLSVCHKIETKRARRVFNKTIYLKIVIIVLFSVSSSIYLFSIRRSIEFGKSILISINSIVFHYIESFHHRDRSLHLLQIIL